MPRMSSLAFHNIRCEAFDIFCSTAEGISADFLSSMHVPVKLEILCAELLRNLVIFPEVGAFDHPKWTYDGAFEQPSGPGRGNLNKNFQKFRCPGGVGGRGMLKLRLNWYVSYTDYYAIQIKKTSFVRHHKSSLIV